jgi:hypothetical protein
MGKNGIADVTMNEVVEIVTIIANGPNGPRPR